MSLRIVPLHPAQKDIFVDQLMFPDKPNYNVGAYIKLNGPLQEALFIQAIQTVARQADLFKMRFDADHQHLQAYFNEADHLPAPGQLDFSGDLHPENAALAWMQARMNTPFLINKESILLEQYLLKIEDEHHWYYFRVHHILYDGYCYTIWCNRITSTYRALLEGKDTADEIPAYETAIGEAAAKYNSPAYEEHAHYWKQRLESKPVHLLQRRYQPTDHAGKESGFFCWTPAPAQVEALESLVATAGLKFPHLFIAATMIYFTRILKQEEICMGTPAHKRKGTRNQQTLGMFTGIVPFKGYYRPDASLLDTLKEVATLQKEDAQHADYILGDLAAHFRHIHTDGPLLDVIVNYVKIDLALDMGKGMEASFHPLVSEYEVEPLRLTWLDYDKKASPQLRIDFRYEYFSDEEIALLTKRIAFILAQFPAALDKPVKSIGIIPQEELNLLQTFSGTTLDYPAEKTIGQLFSEQAQKSPDAMALSCGQQQLTYRELDSRSSRLANYLHKAGVTANGMVPVCLGRSEHLIIALLAILKAGAVYIPLDPRYPTARITTMLEGMDYSVIISNGAYRDHLPDTGHIIDLDSLETVLEWLPEEIATPAISADHPAYVMFTSGSTGRPKGVVVSHRNISSLALGSAFTTFSQTDVLLATGSPSFDAATIEYWGTLLNGGQLVMCEEKILLDTSLLKTEITTRGVTKMWFTASWLNQLVDTDSSVFKALDTVIAGGEKLSEKHIALLRGEYPALTIINGYGPTENTTFSLTYTIKEESFTGSIPIGRPLANRTALILDENRQLLPIGVAGELYVGGAGLSAGYFNQPALSAERFILQEGQRMYRTGDQACWMPDGNVAYLGRLDEQIKIRGHRIEPGEIEQVLISSGRVSQAVVMARAGTDGTRRLVAYLVPTSTYDETAIRQYAAGRLPEYMQPSSWMQLAALPLTPNGKVNKAALPDTEVAAVNVAGYEAPRNEVEQQLVAIWQISLQIERIGIHDDFFQLGGDSIIAIGVTNRMRKAFNRNIRLYDLYQTPTISGLAMTIMAASRVSPQVNDIKEGVKQAFREMKDKLLPQLADAGLVEDIFPMSDIQGGMVAASLLDPTLAIYHDQLAYTLPVDLNIPAFEQAFSLLIQQHAIFRTAFDLDLHPGGVQLVYRSVPVRFDRPTLQQPGVQVTKEDIAAYLQEERKTPFNVRNAPLWRGAIIETEDKHVFVLQFHHAIADGWSIASFNTALNNLYLRICNGEVVSALPLLKNSYKEYVLEMMVEKRSGGTGEFWKEEMAGYKRLDIFTDKEEEQRLVKVYDRSYLHQLKAKAAAENISMKAVFLGAYLYTLSMLSAENELTVGLVTNNRPLLEDGDKILGCFLNSVPFRHSTQAATGTWKAWFDQIEQHLHQIKQYDRTSLLEIRKITGEGFTTENAFFDALFNFVNFHIYDQLEEGLYNADLSDWQKDDNLDTGFESVNTYLNCIASITKDVLVIVYSGRKKLQCGASLEELHAYFNAVLDSFLHHFHEQADRLTILQAVPARLPAVAHGERLAYPDASTVDEIFAARARETPLAIALSCGKESWQYKELDARSNQLAHYLRNAGVSTGNLVAVCLERSAELLIAILGILKAGAAYVPVDPRYPRERITYMLDDIASPVAISNSEYRDLFAADAAVLNLDAMEAILEWMPDHALSTDNHPDSPAYVMYTSGSTGRPKGVIITHRNISSLVMGGGFVTFTKEDRLLATGSPSFDATTLEYWGMLLNGGQLIISAEDKLMDIALLKKEMQCRNVTKMFFTSSWLNQLIDHDLRIFSDVRTVMTGGEKLSEPHIAKLRQAFPALTLINCYGPTENATVSLAYTITESVFPLTVPIGRPLANRAAYILDAWQQLLPVGVPGELCVGGDGLAAGYLRREELTSRYFIAGPGGKRLYRTGDKACWLPDGNAAYLGRFDEQVKIRGHRIEPGEIEQVMAESNMVRQAIVIPRKEEGSALRLIAYVVPAPAHNSTALQAWLAARLPDYMLPSAIIEMQQLPLTTNGKIDKAALLACAAPAAEQTQYQAPRHELEHKLVDIWQQVLHLDHIGIQDDFFRIGGDSIIAIGVISRMRQQISDRIRLFDLYQHSTIVALAGMISKQTPVAAALPILPASIEEQLCSLRDRLLKVLPGSENIADLFPMSDIQRGMVYTSLLEPEMSIYHDQFIYPFPLALNIPVFQQAFERMVKKHGIFRTAFNMEDDAAGIQIVYASVPVKIAFVDQSALDDAAGAAFVQQYLAAERTRPINIRQAPLWRATIVRLAQRHIFLLQFHHAMLDGWSLATFTKELNNIYIDQLNGVVLPDTPVSLKCTYRDFIKQTLEDKQRTGGQAFWKQELADYKRLKLFAENEKHDKVVRNYAPATWNAIKARCVQDGISQKAMFLGISLCVLGMLTHEEEVTLGIITNNRPVVEDGENVLGCFLNTLPVRHHKARQQTWKALFRKVDEHLNTLKEWESTSLADIAKIAGEMATEQNPFTDVIFNFTNFYLYTDMQSGLFSTMMESDDWDVSKVTGYDHVNTFLDFNISITGDMLTIIYGQRKELLCGKTLSDLAYYFDAAMHAYLADENTVVDTAALLSPSEREQLYQLSNSTAIHDVAQGTLVARFREQVIRTPAATALQFEQSSLTYAELDAQSNRLGHYLLHQGVTAGSLVMLCIDPSPEMIIGILGILKAGAAYVPVDTAYPPERMNYIRQDTAATIAICSSRFQSAPAVGNIRVIDLHLEEQAIQQSADTPLPVIIHPGDTAYVIYTSGSTGAPKGVMVHHGGVVNLIADRTAAMEIDSTSQVLLLSRITFDASVEQLFIALFNGATLHLITQETLLDKDAFHSLLTGQQITHLHGTPSLLTGIFPLPSGVSLRTIVSGGEAFPVTLLAECPAHIRCVNEYGPTETTITATAYCCRPQDVQASFIPIGRPVANTRIYLQDLAGNVLPDGVAGEICIAGAGVSKGYLNKPELTALKFVPDPVVQGVWMYRTGDKGCWLPDGQLAYLGRMDEQVKIRGYRIEPGEVESVLQRSGLVQHATVKAEKDAGGHLQLFAYVQLATGVERTVLADWLRTQLPAYMLPARIICLDVMPLTNSGKVNKQLLTPQHTSEESPAQHELPVGPVQTFIATCWKELLGISEVGIYQQFFELGGHSLLLLQLLSRIRKAGYTVQLRDLYENRTIASLSAHLQPNGLHASTDHLLLLRQEAGDIPVFIMPGSDGVSDGYDELAMALPGQYTVYGIQMMGMFEGERALDTIPAIAAQHIAWIKSIQPSGPYRLLGHSFGAYVTYEMVKQLEQQEEEVAFAWLLDAPCPFIPDVVRAADRKAFGWHEVVQLLEQQQVITKAHPVWFTTLKTAAMQLALPDMIHYIIAALVPYTGLRQEYIAFSLRLLHLRMMNTGAPYTPHGDVRAPFVLVKAAEQRWEIHAPAMGWANYIPHIREVSSAGNHFNMVKGKHAEVLASVLADQLHVGS